mmetsp:Transcript_36380/g.87875  ORF Transcript_36380/g.87875 Transcript_36380/m.87875 type:complete len:82 (-) Transcript_36380:689-934(-)
MIAQSSQDLSYSSLLAVLLELCLFVCSVERQTTNGNVEMLGLSSSSSFGKASFLPFFFLATFLCRRTVLLLYSSISTVADR